jgi:hypothetical protein
MELPYGRILRQIFLSIAGLVCFLTEIGWLWAQRLLTVCSSTSVICGSARRISPSTPYRLDAAGSVFSFQARR